MLTAVGRVLEHLEYALPCPPGSQLPLTWQLPQVVEVLAGSWYPLVSQHGRYASEAGSVVGKLEYALHNRSGIGIDLVPVFIGGGPAIPVQLNSAGQQLALFRTRPYSAPGAVSDVLSLKLTHARQHAQHYAAHGGIGY